MVELDFKKGDGILPAIAQDFKSGKVLMLAYMNIHAWRPITGVAHVEKSGIREKPREISR